MDSAVSHVVFVFQATSLGDASKRQMTNAEDSSNLVVALRARQPTIVLLQPLHLLRVSGLERHLRSSVSRLGRLPGNLMRKQLTLTGTVLSHKIEKHSLVV